MSSGEVVFVEGVRTAFDRMGGTIHDIGASKLAAIGIKGLVEKTKILEKAKVDSVCCTPYRVDTQLRLWHTWGVKSNFLSFILHMNSGYPSHSICPVQIK